MSTCANCLVSMIKATKLVSAPFLVARSLMSKVTQPSTLYFCVISQKSLQLNKTNNSVIYTWAGKAEVPSS